MDKPTGTNAELERDALPIAAEEDTVPDPAIRFCITRRILDSVRKTEDIIMKYKWVWRGLITIAIGIWIFASVQSAPALISNMVLLAWISALSFLALFIFTLPSSLDT